MFRSLVTSSKILFSNNVALIFYQEFGLEYYHFGDKKSIHYKHLNSNFNEFLEAVGGIS